MAKSGVDFHVRMVVVAVVIVVVVGLLVVMLVKITKVLVLF